MTNKQFIWLGKVLLAILFALVTSKDAKQTQIQLSIRGQLEKQLKSMEE